MTHRGVSYVLQLTSTSLMCSGLFTLRGPDAGMHVPQIVLRLPPTDKGPVAGDTFLGIPT